MTCSFCDASASPEQLGELYLEVHHRMRRAFDGGMSACGLSLARTKVLSQLQRGPARPSVLAAEFGFAPRTVTELVDTLERDEAGLRCAWGRRPGHDGALAADPRRRDGRAHHRRSAPGGNECPWPHRALKTRRRRATTAG